MTTNPRPALGVVAALALAALTASVLPGAPALAEGGNGSMILTTAQVEELQSQVLLDPYAAADSAPIVTDGVEVPSAAEPTAETGATVDNGKVTVTEASKLEGARGLTDTVALGGAGDDYLAISSLGVIQRLRRDGSPVWFRGNQSYYDEWQLTPLRPWQTAAFPVRVLTGYNAVTPSSPVSDLGYDTGDLTGDGVDDLAVSMSVGTNPFRPFTRAGSTLTMGTFVNVLDGRTGETRWSKLFAHAGAVHVVGSTLVVGDSPGANNSAPAAATATLQGFRFADGAAGQVPSWTHDTGIGDPAMWGGMQELPGGLLAASYSKAKTSATARGAGHTLLVDVADGSLRWQTDGPLYSRKLAFDAGRNRVVALEQTDGTDGLAYELAGYDANAGARTTLSRRVNALPLTMAVGDINGDGLAEYVVSESTLSNNLFLSSSTVRALDPSADQAQLWSWTVKASIPGGDSPGVWDLDIVDGRVLASTQDDTGRGTAENRGGTRLSRLTALSGATGKVQWENRGTVGSAMASEPVMEGKAWSVRTVSGEQNVIEYAVSNGAEKRVSPLRGDVSFATAADVNGDGRKDVIVGGESRGLWAYDGPSMVAGSPKLLWRATLPSSTHGLSLMDSDGRGSPEVLVAGDTATVIVDAVTGKVRTTIDAAGQYVHTVTAADLDGDGVDEVVVPTDQLRAYDARGRLRWAYAAPEADVVFSNVVVNAGRVHAQYNSRGSTNLAAPTVDGVALDSRSGALLWSADPQSAVDGAPIMATVLRNGVFASPDVPYGGRDTVVYSWITRKTPDWRMFTEFRDARTGEVLHTTVGGTFLLHGNFATSPGTLHGVSVASVRSWREGEDHFVNTLPTILNGGLARGPGGRPLFLAGSQGGVEVWDATMPTGGQAYVATIGALRTQGVQAFLAADLDADGVDEVVGLNSDDVGYDRVAALSGGGFYLPNNAMHYLAVGKLGTP